MIGSHRCNAFYRWNLDCLYHSLQNYVQAQGRLLIYLGNLHSYHFEASNFIHGRTHLHQVIALQFNGIMMCVYMCVRVHWSIGPLVHWSIGPLVRWLNVKCHMSYVI